MLPPVFQKLFNRYMPQLLSSYYFLNITLFTRFYDILRFDPTYYSTKYQEESFLIAKALEEKFCIPYVKKYVSLVSIEGMTKEVMKSRREKTVSFSDQIAMIGGTLGLFSGMSILSMVEIICFILKTGSKSVLVQIAATSKK